MSFETIPCPHCGGSGKLSTKAAEDLVPGDVLLPAEPGRLLTIQAVTNQGDDRLTLAGTDEQGDVVYYDGVPRTRRLPVAKKIPDFPGEGPCLVRPTAV